MSRSRSPFSAFKRSLSSERKRDSLQPYESDMSDSESNTVYPNNNFQDSDDSESSQDTEDELTFENTEKNSISNNVFSNELNDEPESFGGGTANLLDESEMESIFSSSKIKRKNSTKAKPLEKIVLSRAVFEKNRCKVTVTRGMVEGIQDKRIVKSYLACSDFSKESQYALEWTIGTLMREGDNLRLVTIMETDEKLDGNVKSENALYQKERSMKALLLAKQVTSILERTRLNVKVHCVAIHSKVLRHTCLDMIDFFEPTLVIIGTRGLSSIKGMLLGSLSSYLIQKSSVPVMVCRRPIKMTPKPSKIKLDSARVHRPLASAAIDTASRGGQEGLGDPDESDESLKRVSELQIAE